MSCFECPFCHGAVPAASAGARWLVFNVAVRQVVEGARQLRAGDVLVVVDSTVHPEDHAIHRCDDPTGKTVAAWFQHRASEAYSAINYNVRKSLLPVEENASR